MSISVPGPRLRTVFVIGGLLLSGCGQTPPEVALSGCPEQVSIEDEVQLRVDVDPVGEAVGFETTAEPDGVTVVDGGTAAPVIVADDAGRKQVTVTVSTRDGATVAVDCAFEVCGLATCASDSDCDDGEACTTDACLDLNCLGATVCSSQDIAGCVECVDDSECPEHPDPDCQLCEDGRCVQPDCFADRDCDDGVFCNGPETCGACTCTGGQSPCTASERCDEASDSCQAPCETDAVCDDGLACNGAEVCADGFCGSGEPPCKIFDTCTEGNPPQCTAVCACDDDEDPETFGLSGRVFTRTVDDICGDADDEIVEASLQFSPEIGAQVTTLQTDDCLDGLEGYDILEVVFSATRGTTVKPDRIVRVEELEVVDIGAARTVLDVEAACGIERVRSLSSTQVVTIRNLAEYAEVELSNTGSGAVFGFADAVTADGGTLDVHVEETFGGTLTIEAGNGPGFDAMNLAVSGLCPAVLAAMTQEAGEGAGWTALAVSGDQLLELQRVDGSVVDIDASGMTAGGLQLGGGDGSAERPFVALHGGANGAVSAITGSVADDLFVFAATLDADDGSTTVGDWIDGGDGVDGVQAVLFGAEVDVRAASLEELHLRATAPSSFDTAEIPDLQRVWISGAAGHGIQSIELLDIRQDVPPTLHFRGDGQALTQAYDRVSYGWTAASAPSDAVLEIIIDNREVPLNESGTLNRHAVGGLSIMAVPEVDILISDGPLTFANGIVVDASSTITVTSASSVDLGVVDATAVEGGVKVDAGAVAGIVTCSLDSPAAGATLQCGPANDSITMLDGAATSSVIMLGEGDDVFESQDDDAADTVDAGDGADVISSGGGADSLTGGAGRDTFDLSATTANTDAKDILDFESGASGDILRLDAATFTEYTAGAAVELVEATEASARLTATVDTVVVVGDTADILQVTPSDGDQAVIAVARDTGIVLLAPDGDFTAGAVTIAALGAAEVESLHPNNFEVVP